MCVFKYTYSVYMWREEYYLKQVSEKWKPHRYFKVSYEGLIKAELVNNGSWAKLGLYPFLCAFTSFYIFKYLKKSGPTNVLRF